MVREKLAPPSLEGTAGTALNCGCCLRGEWSLARGVDLLASSEEDAAPVSRVEYGERLTPLAFERHVAPDAEAVLWARVEDEDGRSGWLRDPGGAVESLTRCD